MKIHIEDQIAKKFFIFYWYLKSVSVKFVNNNFSLLFSIQKFNVSFRDLDLFSSFPENSTERCTYPSWVVDNKLWLALDPVASRLLASPYNLTILNRQETRLVCHSVVPINDRHYHPDRENQVQYVAKATLDWWVNLNFPYLVYFPSKIKTIFWSKYISLNKSKIRRLPKDLFNALLVE